MESFPSVGGKSPTPSRRGILQDAIEQSFLDLVTAERNLRAKYTGAAGAEQRFYRDFQMALYNFVRLTANLEGVQTPPALIQHLNACFKTVSKSVTPKIADQHLALSGEYCAIVGKAGYLSAR